MEKTIFREKNVNELNSPDELNEYLRVTSPSIWLVMAAVIVLLLGLIVWASVGEIHTKESATVNVKGDEATVYVSGARADMVRNGNIVEIDGQRTVLTDVSFDEYGRAVGKAKVSDLSEGTYQAEVIVESIKPISFLFR
jgi:hypothetical protein